jgi:phenylacetate-coenzyme A ligase PaaK-like adenylate-forming protein
VGRDGGHHPEQGGRPVNSIPHPGHHPHHSRKLYLRFASCRHSRIKGRSDDTIKFRGVNIYPSTIDTILSAIPGLGSEYQIHLTREEKSGKDS